MAYRGGQSSLFPGIHAQPTGFLTIFARPGQLCREVSRYARNAHGHMSDHAETRAEVPSGMGLAHLGGDPGGSIRGAAWIAARAGAAKVMELG